MPEVPQINLLRIILLSARAALDSLFSFHCSGEAVGGSEMAPGAEGSWERMGCWDAALVGQSPRPARPVSDKDQCQISQSKVQEISSALVFEIS